MCVVPSAVVVGGGAWCDVSHGDVVFAVVSRAGSSYRLVDADEP